MNQIVERIEKHYTDSDHVLLASKFGAELVNDGLWPIDGENRKLIEYLESLADDIRIERDGAYVVISDIKNHEKILSAVEKRKIIHFLQNVPRSILLAFSIKLEDGKSVYLQTKSPFKYFASSEVPKIDYVVELAEVERQPGLAVYSLNDLSLDAMREFSAKIQAWMAKTGVSEDDFRLPRRETLPIAEAGRKTETALERLVSAQPAQLREKLVIPADIALLLARNS